MGDVVDEFVSELSVLIPASNLYTEIEYGGYVDDLNSASIIYKHKESFSGFMTDRIDIIGPYFKSKQQSQR